MQLFPPWVLELLTYIQYGAAAVGLLTAAWWFLLGRGQAQRAQEEPRSRVQSYDIAPEDEEEDELPPHPIIAAFEAISAGARHVVAFAWDHKRYGQAGAVEYDADDDPEMAEQPHETKHENRVATPQNRETPVFREKATPEEIATWDGGTPLRPLTLEELALLVAKEKIGITDAYHVAGFPPGSTKAHAAFRTVLQREIARIKQEPLYWQTGTDGKPNGQLAPRK